MPSVNVQALHNELTSHGKACDPIRQARIEYYNVYSVPWRRAPVLDVKVYCRWSRGPKGLLRFFLPSACIVGREGILKGKDATA